MFQNKIGETAPNLVFRIALPDVRENLAKSAIRERLLFDTIDELRAVGGKQVLEWPGAEFYEVRVRRRIANRRQNELPGRLWIFAAVGDEQFQESVVRFRGNRAFGEVSD